MVWTEWGVVGAWAPRMTAPRVAEEREAARLAIFFYEDCYLSHRIVDSFSVNIQIKIYRIYFNFVGTKQGYRNNGEFIQFYGYR